MKFTPVLIVYIIVLIIAIIAVKELNSCTQKLERYKIHILPGE
jgi:hypothetical protein